jgi:predicted ATPase
MKYKSHLSELQVSGFKALESARIQFQPLTLLIGMNSVGKSSVIQSILALSQWVQSGSPIGNFDYNGKLAMLGTFKDIQTQSASRTPTPWNEIRIFLQTAKHGLLVSNWVDGVDGRDWDQLSAEVKSFSFSTPDAKYSFHMWDSEPIFSFESQGVDIQISDKLDMRNDSLKFGPLRKEYRFNVDEFLKQPALGELSKLPLLSRVNSLEYILNVFKRFMATSINDANGNVPFFTKIQLVPLADFLDLVKTFVTNDETALELKRSLESPINSESVTKSFEQTINDRLENAYNLRIRLDLATKLYQDLDSWTTSGYKPQGITLPDLSPLMDTSERMLENYSDLSVDQEIQIIEFLSGWKELDFFTSDIPKLSNSEELQEFKNSVESEWVKDSIGNISWAVYDKFYEENDAVERLSIDLVTPVDELSNSSDDFVEWFETGLTYLGPLRENGYHSASIGSRINPSLPVGASGEYTPILLDSALSDTTIRKRPHFDPISRKWELKDCTFRESISSWFRLFTSPSGDLSIEKDKRGVRIKMNEKTLDQFGTGASQVLPILALVLSREPGDVVLIEQPELHLHPGGQQHLADFFMAANATGIQIIAETHSEYMVNRVRRGAVLGYIDSAQVQLVNFEQDDNGLAIVNNVGMTDSGGFADWPQGFFAETEEDLLDIIMALEEGQADT